ncbi:Pectin lyase fold/virulence factor [Pseudocohnilembus persalinus]|uniref:Pectin lyase fold/virulence factor n=1 Tax=Pseudocohnilembus persalinus TaxID=266149 RepID=A0A0V0QK16_PSEPJ|nr:Pectin lyase fold/virulence factor [Pseudocohnilembus persalinus]|eukprot:KRX02444.1 Pectin lyase fold/virulence factor [Pseudocohnilembus persalinus]
MKQPLFIFTLTIIFALILYSNQLNSVGVYEEELVGCYDNTSTSTCLNTLCRKGCIDCTSDNVCTSCEYGWFIFHTPQNTIECVQCPYYDIDAYNAGTYDLNYINQCANCLELPFQWEKVRKCSQSYLFYENTSGNGAQSTPQNVTSNLPDLFTIVVDTDQTQNNVATRYYVQQMTPHCDNYDWKNYEIDTLISLNEIDEILETFNDVVCEECLTGFILTDDNQCEACGIDNCQNCYLNPSSQNKECIICNDGYSPSSDKLSCKKCSELISLCTDCIFNSLSGNTECTECATDYRPSSDASQCEPQNCQDSNCKSCPYSDYICEQCEDRYEVDSNYECSFVQSCKKGTANCQQCYQYVAANDPVVTMFGLQCLYCEGQVGNYECLEYCQSYYGYSFNDATCVSCLNYMDKCKSCIIDDDDEFECLSCGDGFGFDDQLNSCRSCSDVQTDGTCEECEYIDGDFYCFDCQDGYGIVLYSQGFYCKKCQDNCSSCFFDTDDNINFIQTCIECDSEMYKISDDYSKCQYSCDQLFGGNCSPDQCIANDYYQKYSSNVSIYPSQQAICKTCIPGYSLNSSGDECTENVKYCKNTLRFTTSEYLNINPFVEFLQEKHIGYCYNGCRDDGNSGTLFYDPNLQKCVDCDDSDKCRKKVTINRYIYCSENLSDMPPFLGVNDEWLSIKDFNSDFLSFDFDFNDNFYSSWNTKGVSFFEFNIVFVGSNNIQDKQCIIPGGIDVSVSSNIPKYIFRVSEINVNFVTWKYSTDIADANNFNTIQMDIFSNYYSFSVQQISKFSINNINFYGSKLYANESIELKESGEYDVDFAEFYLEMIDNLPNSKLYLSSVTFQHQLNSFIVPKFILEDLGELNLSNFEYSSKLTTSETLTGFKMFQFKKNIWQVQKFNLIVDNFILTDMMFDKVVFFEIPQKEAYIEMKNIILDTIILKSSQFIGDTSSGLGTGQQWYVIENLNVSNIQLFDSSLIYITNSRFLNGKNWFFSGIYNILVENDQQALINLNSYLLETIYLSQSTFYGTTFVQQNSSPSLVTYYKDYNKISSLFITEVALYLNQNQRFISLKGNLDLKIDTISIDGVHTTLDTTLYNDIITYVYNDEYEVYSYSRYKVSAVVDKKVPLWLIEINNDVLQNTVKMENINFYGIDDISILYFYNVKNVEIEGFECGSKTDERFDGQCIKTYVAGSIHADKFYLTDSLIINTQSSSNPLYISGYSDTKLIDYKAYNLKVKSGVYLDPSGSTANILIQNCQLQYIKTFLDQEEAIQGAGFFIDQQTATSLTLNMSEITFSSMMAKDKAAGIYINCPTYITYAYLDTIVFQNVFALKGAAIYVQLASTDKGFLSLKNIDIQGPGKESTYEFKQTIGILDGEEAEVFNLQGYDNYFGEILQYGVQGQKFTNIDKNNLYMDSFINEAVDDLSAIYIIESTITIELLSIKNVYLQQGFQIQQSTLDASQLNIKEVICINCSEYKGSNALIETDFSIENSSFKNCESYYGGGLFVSNQGVCTVHGDYCQISNSYFQNNWANAEGGGLYIQDTLFQIQNSFFINNTAQGDYSDSDNPVRGEGGGILSSCSSVLPQEDDRRILASYKNILKKTFFEKNIAEFGAAGKITGGISLSQDDNTFQSNKASKYGDDMVTHCVYGEGQQTGGVCYECPEDQYSLDEEGSTCSACMEHATCYGGDRVILNAGYWRAHNYTAEIVHCKNQPENCLQVDSVDKNNFTCQTGYVGALCQACDLRGLTTDGVRYSVSSNYNCGKCDDQVWNGMKVFLVNLWVLISMFIAVKGTLQLVQEKIMLKSILTLFRGFRAKYNETGILIKMFMNYAQIIFILSTLDISLPSFLTNGQDNIGNPVKSMGNALDCYLILIQQKIPNIYFKIIWQLIVNLIQFVMFFFLYQIYKKISKKQIKNSYLIWTSLIYQLIYLQPSYVNIILETISCVEYGGYSWILADVQYQCYTDEYWAWTIFFLVPFLIFWVILLPSLMFYMLFKQKKNGTLQNSKNLYKFGFLYQEYKQDAFYWELVKVVQKTLIVAVIQLYSNEIKEKAILVFEIVFIYGIIVYFKHPYQSNQLNQLDIIIAIVCCLSLITGVFIYQIPYSGWEIWGLIVIFITNVWLIAYIVYLIFKKSIDDLNQKHAEKIEKLKAKIPFLRKIFKQSPQIIKNRKAQWKLIRQQVKLYIDGKQAGIIYSTLPSPYDIDDENIQQYEEDQQLLNSLSSQKSFEKVKNVYQQIQKNQKRRSTINQDMEIYSANFVRTPTSKKTFIVPDMEDSNAKIFKKSISGKKYSSIEILRNKINGQDKKRVLNIIDQYREARRKDLLETKSKYRKYFIEKWDIKSGKCDEVELLKQQVKINQGKNNRFVQNILFVDKLLIIYLYQVVAEDINEQNLNKESIKFSQKSVNFSEELSINNNTPKNNRQNKQKKYNLDNNQDELQKRKDSTSSKYSLDLTPENTEIKIIKSNQKEESVQTSLLLSQRNKNAEIVDYQQIQQQQDTFSPSSDASILKKQNRKSQQNQKKSKFNFTEQSNINQKASDQQQMLSDESQEFVDLSGNSPNIQDNNEKQQEVSFESKKK